jgi:tetratricopeptide (TPR) repeat protein
MALFDDLRLGKFPYIADVAIEEGAEAGLAYYKKLEDADLLWLFGFRAGRFMNGINSQGYELLSEGRFEAALELFKLNTMVVPRYWNAWDSLAECYYRMKQYDLSIRYYEKSLELNPDNMNAVEMLEKIRAEYPGKH